MNPRPAMPLGHAFGAAASIRPAPEADSGPWWRHLLMWMVVGGPAVVVLAGIATAWIAMRAPDPVVEPGSDRKGAEINRTRQSQRVPRALAPAQQGRNHANTPTADLPL